MKINGEGIAPPFLTSALHGGEYLMESKNYKPFITSLCPSYYLLFSMEKNSPPQFDLGHP
jgi:hypothetical protein